MCIPCLQGDYSGAEGILRKALEGADEHSDELVEVGYALHVLADALQRQVGLGEIVQTTEHFLPESMHCRSWLG